MKCYFLLHFLLPFLTLYLKPFKVKSYKQDIKHLILSVEFNTTSLKIFNQDGLKYDTKGMELKWFHLSFPSSTFSTSRRKYKCLSIRGERVICWISSVRFSVRLFATPWIAAHQASLSITNSWSALRRTSIESVMPSSHLILCRPLFLLPPIPPSVSLFQWVNSSHEVAKVLEFQL